MIFAGVTLKIIIDNNFVDKALTAADKTVIQSYKEKIQMLKVESAMDKISDKKMMSIKNIILEKLEKADWVNKILTSEEEDYLENNQIQIITEDLYSIIIEINEDGSINYISEEKYDGEPYPKIILLDQIEEETESEKIGIRIIAKVEKTGKTKNIEKIEIIQNEKTIQTKKCQTQEIDETIEVEESGTYTIKITTNQGKSIKKQITISGNIIQITAKPTTPRNTIKTETQNGIETGPITITINYGETDLQKQYKIVTDQDWTTVNTESITIPITQNTQIIARYTKDGENSVKSTTYNVKNVDNIAPTITDYQIEAEGTTIKISSVQAQDTADEGAAEGEHPTAEIGKILYSINGTNYQEQNTFTINEAKQYTIYVKAIDKAGNETIKNDQTIKAYTVNFDATGGTIDTTNKIVLQNAKYGELPTPTKEGCEFAGWYTDPKKINGDQITEDTTVNISSNQTLYAQWNANMYTLTIKHYLENANDTNYTYQAEKTTTEQMSYGTEFALADGKTTIENGTYNYGSLIESESGGEPIETTTMGINTTICLYYQRKTTQLRLNGDAGIDDLTGEGIDSDNWRGTYKIGASVNISAVIANGYKFDRWEVQVGTGTIEDANSASTTVIVNNGESAYMRVMAYTKEGPNIIPDGNNISGNRNGMMVDGEFAYNNPVIPVGFKTLDTEDAKWESTDGKTINGWNNGLVITDAETNGNEFVWVPVDGTNVRYEKWCTTGVSYSNTTNYTLPSGVTSEQTQITQYGGFYIARYEAGTNLAYASRDTVAMPLSKKNQIPWNQISMSSAKSSAEGMYAGSYVKSGLVTGAMWDTTLKWLKNENINVETNCTGWGNYYNAEVTGITMYSTDYGKNWTSAMSSKTKPTSGSSNADYRWLLPTGHTDYTKRKNIYDLAGNLNEWTNEKCSTSYYVYRGGRFIDDGTSLTVACRNGTVYTTGSSSCGFRVCLYVQ